MIQDDKKEFKFKYSRYRARELTDFFSEELIYDYMTQSMDIERLQAFEKHLLKSSSIKEKIAHTNSILKEVEELDRIRISEEVMQALIPTQKGVLQKFKKGLQSQQFQSRKYFYFQYIFLFSAISLFIFLTPWRQLIPFRNFDNEGKIVLTEVRNSKDEIKKRIQARKDEIANEKENEFSDESNESIAGATVATNEASVKPEVAELNELSHTNEKSKDLAQGVVKPTPSTTSKPTSSAATQTKVDSGAVASAVANLDTGYVYRGTVRIASLEVNGVKITEYIKSLGGRKAGDVELGWRKGPKVMYYHFTIPEGKYEELKKFMENFGRTNISKDKHPRKMPQGILRLIVEVEESS